MFSLLSTAKFRRQKSRIRGLLLYGHQPMRTRIPQNLRIPFRGSEDFFLYVSHVCLTDSKNKGDSAVYRYTSDLTYETYTSSYTSNPQILKRRRYVAVPKILEMKPQNLRFVTSHFFVIWSFEVFKFLVLKPSDRGLQNEESRKTRGLGSKRAEDFRKTHVLRIFYFVCFDC